MHDVLAISVPVVAILFGILLSRADVKRLEEKMEKRFDKMDARFDTIDADLRRLHHHG